MINSACRHYKVSRPCVSNKQDGCECPSCDRAVAPATNQARYAANKARFTDAAWARRIGNIGKFTAEFERSLTAIMATPPPLRS
jgi:hypothetical protein